MSNFTKEAKGPSSATPPQPTFEREVVHPVEQREGLHAQSI